MPTMLAAVPISKAKAFPQLRDDIVLADAGYDISGERGVILHDPVQYQFIRLSSAAAALLKNFRNISEVESDAVRELADFLKSARLLKPEAGTAAQLTFEHQRRHQSLALQFLHHYIFFRLALLNPERFLDLALPVVRLLATRGIFVLLATFGVLGVYFASRQWDHFLVMLVSSFSLAGAANYALTMVVLKIFHELGHAFVARHFGCRVPTIGVAFMVLTPMVYTDASDAWRLSSRRQRAMIGAAGIIVEAGIAAVALFLWVFLPDGVARGMAFFVAVTALTMSLLVNLSPFMQFDGYHILVDLLGMHNLGPRSFALANWRLREWLFKPDDPPPEFFAPGLSRFLIWFAYATWAYRLMLFLGIAYLVYTLFPKAVGLPLAMVEVHFFILRPVLRELQEWKSMGLKQLFSTRRAMVSTAIGVAGLVLAVLPLDRHVLVPAVFLPAQEARLFAPEPAEVMRVTVKPGEKVEQGQVLAHLFVPNIGHLQRIAQLRLEVTEGRLTRIADDAQDLAELRVLEQQRETTLAELDGLAKRGALLVLHAPLSGVVSGDASTLHEGQSVSSETLLFHIVDPSQGRIVALVAEQDAGRLAQGADVSFVAADGLQRTVHGSVEAAGLPGAEGPAAMYLSSQFGGPIAVNPSASRGFEPMTGRIPMMIAAQGAAPSMALVGTARIAAEPTSLAAYLLGRIVIVFMRENGF
jgi:putative peptide zinc metalloprotease protein